MKIKVLTETKLRQQGFENAKKWVAVEFGESSTLFGRCQVMKTFYGICMYDQARTCESFVGMCEMIPNLVPDISTSGKLMTLRDCRDCPNKTKLISKTRMMNAGIDSIGFNIK